jgi:DNA-binding GntR family transcriptional regulator
MRLAGDRMMEETSRNGNVHDTKPVSKMLFAYEEIKEAIITERYKPDKLLSGRELAEELGVSRTPVMEALRRLSYEGFVEHIPDKGMFVTKVRFEDLLELYEIKEGIEGIAARLCALRKTDQIIKKMEDCLAKYEDQLSKGKYLKAVDTDNQFHMLFISGARNSRMEKYMQVILEQSKRGVYLSASDPDRMKNIIVPTHRRILDAIKEGNGELAEKLAKEHMQDVQKFFVDYQTTHHYF